MNGLAFGSSDVGEAAVLDLVPNGSATLSGSNGGGEAAILVYKTGCIGGVHLTALCDRTGKVSIH